MRLEPLSAEKWPLHSVESLQQDGCLLVEDGNHGEDRPRPEEFVADGTAFIRAADMAGGRVMFETAEHINDVALHRIRKGMGKGGDVLFSHKGTVGKLALVPQEVPPFVCSPQTTFWRTLDERRIDRRFLYCFMRSQGFREQWEAVKGETDMADYVSLTAQRRFQIAVPPLSAQHAIASMLGALDDKIELNRQMSRTLEAMARALFKSWFVDFDPVIAKAAGRQPVGMDADTATVFPSRFVESELGPIPETWRTIRLVELADINRESLTADFEHSEIEYIDISSVSEGRLLASERMPLAAAPSRAQRRVQHGDTIWSCVRPNRRSFLMIHRPAPNCVVSTGFAVITPKSFAQSFVYVAVTSTDFVEHLTAHAEGSAYPAVRPAVFESAQLVPAESSAIALFSNQCDRFLEYAGDLQIEERTLAALRDTLLPKLLSGEIRVKDAEKAVEKAL